MDLTKISFPGLGIGAIEIPAAAFSIGSFQVSWTLLALIVGAVLAFLYASVRVKRAEHVSAPRIVAIGISALVVGLIFARGGYVLSTLKTVDYGSFYDVAAFWNGGLSVNAGILGAIIGAMIVSDLCKYRGARVLDALLPAVLILQLVASVATFLCATETVAIGDTSSYYLFRAPIECAVSDGGLLNLIRMEVARGGEIVSYHPLFLYQFIWNLIALIAVHLTYKRRSFSGQTALVYFAFYGFGLMLLSGLAPSVSRWNVPQCLGLIIFAAALIALIVYTRSARRFSVTVEGEIPAYRTFTRKMTDEERAAKREADLEEASAILDNKVEDHFAELNGKSSKERG